MGGLVGQYFIARLGGWEDVAHFITLGTPSKGSMDSLRAFVEGEYPDTLWSTLTGFLPFNKRAANFVFMSFPSMFQLLPRYPGAIEQGDLRDFGLASPPGELQETLDGVFDRRYRTYGIVPDLTAAGEALGRRVPLKERVIRQHFTTQLRSAACFHGALDGTLTAEDEKYCGEEKRVKDAIAFLQEVYPRDIQRLRPAGLDDATRIESLIRSGRAPGPTFSGRIVYGGHCTETTTCARLVRGDAPDTGRMLFIGNETPEGQASGDEPVKLHYGDGRVPFRSAHFRRPNELWATSFFLCADHMDTVKDRSFQYNLLRSLLAQSQ
jgi:hypothetical protein